MPSVLTCIFAYFIILDLYKCISLPPPSSSPLWLIEGLSITSVYFGGPMGHAFDQKKVFPNKRNAINHHKNIHWRRKATWKYQIVPLSVVNSVYFGCKSFWYWYFSNSSYFDIMFSSRCLIATKWCIRYSFTSKVLSG